MACASSARAPSRKTSVSGSGKVSGWESRKTLVSVTAYHSFGGEVEASNTPTIRRLTPSRRHQLSLIALWWRLTVNRMQDHHIYSRRPDLLPALPTLATVLPGEVLAE